MNLTRNSDLAAQKRVAGNSKSEPKPVAVRDARTANPEGANRVNGECLAVSQFSTEN